MNNMQPGPLLMLGGGVVMVLGSILDWRGESGLSFESNGLFGILVLLFGAALAAVGGIRAFAPQTSLPAAVGGLPLDFLLTIAAFTAFLFSFALITADFIDAGVHLTWLGAAAATVGTVLGAGRASSSSSSF